MQKKKPRDKRSGPFEKIKEFGPTITMGQFVRAMGRRRYEER